jgi:hypothetical protein
MVLRLEDIVRLINVHYTPTYAQVSNVRCGFGGVVVPKFAGSNPAEAVGFFGRKNPQHAFLRRGSKAVCPMSQLCGMLKNPVISGSRFVWLNLISHFSPIISPFTNRGLLSRLAWSASGDERGTKAGLSTKASNGCSAPGGISAGATDRRRKRTRSISSSSSSNVRKLLVRKLMLIYSDTFRCQYTLFREFTVVLTKVMIY